MKTMKLTIKFISVLLLLVTISIALLSIDDKLNPEILERYQAATEHKNSDAFVYLWGMQAATDEDPMIVGKELIQSMIKSDEKRLSSSSSNQEYDFKNYPENKKLAEFTLPSCKSDSNNTENECDYFDQLTSYTLQSDSINNNEKVLLVRYKVFLSKNDFHSITQPHMSNPIPGYKYFIQGNDVNNLLMLQLAKNGQYETALIQLQQTIKELRKFLAQADNLIAKIIFASVISKNLDVYSVISQQSKLTSIKNIEPLSSSERSFEKPMNNELSTIYNLTRLMGNVPQLLSQEMNTDMGFSWFQGLMYKPNMTINASYPLYKQAAEFSHLSSDQFTQKISESNELPPKNFNIRNYIGTVLTSISSPDFKQYIARVFALDAKIELLNNTSNNYDEFIDTNTIKNPFYPNEKSAFYSKDKKSICFDIPLLKKQEHRCLRLSY